MAARCLPLLGSSGATTARWRCLPLLLWLAASRAAPAPLAGANATPAAERVVVRTKLGSLRGKDYGHFVAFKGVPYAERPGRFAAPEPKQSWGGETLDATRFGDACIHGGLWVDLLDPSNSYGNSEDCLFANVWVPKVDHSKGPLPVVVFIHGGAFIVESGAAASFWGDAVVADPERPVIYVSFNYRLGIFGFYSSEDAGANFGLRDQQQLLRFVHEHIAAFGGDPHRVTVSGQSAGAMSVVCHLAAPGSRGLFSRAVSISPVGLHYRTMAENAPFVRTVAVAAGCGARPNVTECLRALPARALEVFDIAPEYMFHALGPCKECDNFLPWLPVVEPATLPLSPLNAIRRGLHNAVPTLISTTSNETLGFFPTPFMVVGRPHITYDVLLRILMKDRATAVKQHYAETPDTAHMRDGIELMGIVSTDALMGCYARYLSRKLSEHSPSVYLSTFSHAPKSCDMPLNEVCLRGLPGGAACHACDLPYQLIRSARSTARTGVGYFQKGERELAETYTSATLRFVYGDEHEFAAYRGDIDASNIWTIKGRRTELGYHRSHCDFLESVGFGDDPWDDSVLQGAGSTPVDRPDAAVFV